MLTKIYMMLWFAVLFTAGAIFVTGSFTMLTAVVFGFITFGLVFMGMMSVLPATVAHRKPVQMVVSVEARPTTKRPISIAERVHAFTTELISANGVEVRKPKYP